jgi:hypothetical protein
MPSSVLGREGPRPRPDFEDNFFSFIGSDLQARAILDFFPVFANTCSRRFLEVHGGGGVWGNFKVERGLSSAPFPA